MDSLDRARTSVTTSSVTASFAVARTHRAARTALAALAAVGVVGAATTGAGCSAGTASGAESSTESSTEHVGNTRAKIVVSGSGSGSYPWVIRAGDGLPTDGALVSHIARTKRKYLGSAAGVVPATGSYCAIQTLPVSAPGECNLGPAPTTADLLSLDVNDQVISLGAPGGTNNAQAFDFTGRGLGEAMQYYLGDNYYIGGNIGSRPASCFGSIEGYTGITYDGCFLSLTGESLYDSTSGGEIASTLWPEAWTGWTFGDFNGDGKIDALAWNSSSNPATAFLDHQLRLISFDVNGNPSILATAAEGQRLGTGAGNWLPTASDVPLAAGNFGGGTTDELLIQSAWGLGFVAYDSTASNPTHLTAPWMQAYGATLGPLTLSTTTTAQAIGDVDGDGVDDLLFFDVERPGTVVVASPLTYTVHYAGTHQIRTAAPGLAVLATLTAGSTLPFASGATPGWTLAPEADGSLNIVGAYMDGSGVANLVYSGPSGIMVAKYASSIGGFQVIASALPGVRVGGWIVGTQTLGAPIRRTNGTDAVFVSSGWGVGLFDLVGGQLANPWLGAYDPEPTPQLQFCCESGAKVNTTVVSPAASYAAGLPGAVAQCGGGSVQVGSGPCDQSAPTSLCCVQGLTETSLEVSHSASTNVGVVAQSLCSGGEVFDACPALSTAQFCCETGAKVATTVSESAYLFSTQETNAQAACGGNAIVNPGPCASSAPISACCTVGSTKTTFSFDYATSVSEQSIANAACGASGTATLGACPGGSSGGGTGSGGGGGTCSVKAFPVCVYCDNGVDNYGIPETVDACDSTTAVTTAANYGAETCGPGVNFAQATAGNCTD